MLEAKYLKTEHLVTPSGIVVGDTEFTWILRADRDGEGQTACEVEVDRIAPDGNATAVWRSGRLARQIGEEVRYAGEALASRSDYRWRVRIWDRNDQVGNWSDWANFETGVMAPDAIQAPWIFGGGALRKKFTVRVGLQRARAYVTGLGYYECFCNGRKVSAAALAPSFTEFNRRIEYEIIDLLPGLREGGNCLGFVLADGWWRHGGGSIRSRANQALAEIVLEYADGSREVLSASEEWRANKGPFLPGSEEDVLQLFNGIALDLEWLAGDWCQHESSEREWTPAQVAGPEQCAETSRNAPTGRNGQLVPTLLPPIREVETLSPRVVKRHSANLLAIDFGQNFTGWIRFRANAGKGDRFVVRHAELVFSDGRLNPGTLREAAQTDTFALSGKRGEVVEPRLLYHGFRHAEIEGPIDAIELDSIEGVVIHTDLEPVGTVVTSDERINWLLGALRWTVRSNAMGIITDVCQRTERRGWLMDGATAMKAGLLFYNMDPMARKWVEDMIDLQEEDGSLRADSAPAFACSKSPGWQRAIILVPWALYETTGDIALLRRVFPHMCRYGDYLLSSLKDGLLPPGFSKYPTDWLAVVKGNDQVAFNAVAIDALRLLARSAAVLGDSRADHYSQAADKMAECAIRQWSPGNKRIRDTGWKYACNGDDYAQANHVYALRFGMALPGDRLPVFDSMVEDMMLVRGEGPFVTTGIGSTEHVPFVLDDFGRADLVWDWLQRDTWPGYGFMHKNGATAIWEQWDLRTDPGMNAHNHTGLTGIATWLRERLVGIRVEPGPEPIFHLRPALHLPLASLSANWQSRWGEVKVSWDTQDGHQLLTVSIPPGCGARLHLPDGFWDDNNPSDEAIELDSGTVRITVGQSRDTKLNYT